MCGRYTIIRGNQILEVMTNVTMKADLHFIPRYNVSPSQQVPVILNTPERELLMCRWGLIPSWAKDEKIGYKMINARAETLAEKPGFRSAFKSRRCLIPADGFYEWRKDPGDKKTPMHIRLKGGPLFTFAGLWETWQTPSGEPLRSCTIITTAPNVLTASIHDRMPVILPAALREKWLIGGSPDELKAMLKPFPPDTMKAYAVSTIVNSPRNETPDCVKPV